MKNFQSTVMASLLALSFGLAKPSLADTQYVTIAQSKPYVAADTKVQKFEEYISLSKGYDKVPLYLTYYNGSKTAPAFRWVRISSPSSTMRYISENDFKNGTVTLNVSGEVTWGSNQVMVTGEGPQGATLNWTLVTPKATVSTISGENGNAPQGGHKVLISGTNLPNDPSVYKVYFNQESATVSSVKPAAGNQTSAVEVVVPEDLTGGLYTVSVYEVDRLLGTLATNVISTPKLINISPAYAAAATEVVITGENFSPNIQENQVEIGAFSAQVVSASATTLRVIVPINFANQFPQPFQDVKVSVKGVRAVGHLTININQIG